MLKENQQGPFKDKMPSSPSVERKNFTSPENDVRNFSNGKIELIDIAGKIVSRATFRPGWRWSKDVKPIAKTQWCEVPHFFYQISGVMHVKMENGTDFEIGPGDVVYIPAGHDGWVVGQENVVMVDWFASTDYAKPRS